MYRLMNRKLSYDQFEKFLYFATDSGVISNIEVYAVEVYDLPEGVDPFTYKNKISVGDGSVQIQIVEDDYFFGRKIGENVHIENCFFSGAKVYRDSR